MANPNGNINRAYLADCVFVVIDNGNEIAWRVNDAFMGGAGIEIYVRWKWDTLFSLDFIAELGGFDDWGLLNDFLTTGNMWDQGTPSWRQILNGAIYVSTQDGQPHTGVEGCGYKLSDWLVQNTTAACESATDTRWWRAHIIPDFIQKTINTRIAGLVTPAAPTPRPIPVYPPTQKGRVKDMTSLLIAQSRRMTGRANGNLVVVDTLPVAN